MSIHVISLCTGNAARSVMLGALLGELRPDVEVTTAGTHVVDGQPISRRTRAGLAAIGLSADTHRSAQLVPDDLTRCDLVIAMAHEHVRWIRRIHPEAADHTAMIRPLSMQLPLGSEPLRSRLAGLEVASWEPDPAQDVIDPAGGEDEDYVRCAKELDLLARELAPRL